MKIIEDGRWRRLRSDGYNYDFNRETGLFVRWGATLVNDAEWSPYGPEIADIEISAGDCSAGCPWCYKSNEKSNGRHMGLKEFWQVLDSMPPTLTQVALGITDANAHPDFVGILETCRERGIVPNYTTAGYGLTDRIVDATRELCGAVAVSAYPHNNWKETIARFRGMSQVNIHLLFHAHNIEFVQNVLRQAENLQGLNAVVLLGLKPKGRADGWQPLGQEAFNQIVDSAKVRIGFDSCTAPKFESWATGQGRSDLLVYSERCESSLFSIYVDVNGRAWPCSFSEGCPSVESVPVEGAWRSPQFQAFRERLLKNGRECPLYNLKGE